MEVTLLTAGTVRHAKLQSDLLLSTLGSYRPDALPVAQSTVSEYCDVPKVGSRCVSWILYSNELQSEVSQVLSTYQQTLRDIVANQTAGTYKLI